MQHRADFLDQRTIQTLCNSIQLWRVVYGKSARGTSVCEVLIECLAQVFAATVRTQDLDCSAVVLGVCPGLELPVD